MVSQGILLAWFQKIGGVALSLVLVRLLAPEDFGIFAVASTVILLLMTVSAERFVEYSFYVQDKQQVRFDRHFGFAIIVHGAIAVIVLVAAVVASRFETYAPAAPLLAFGVFAPILNAPRIIYSVSLRRDLNWRRIRTLGIVAFAFSASCTLLMALNGFGAFALMAQIVLNPLPYCIDMWLKRRDLYKFSVPRGEYRRVLHFGGLRSGGDAAMQGRLLAESLIMGGSYGIAALGVYGRAFGLAQLTTGWLSSQIAVIVYPLLTKVDARSNAHCQYSGLLIRLCLWISLPLAVTVGLSREAAVVFLYGEKWIEVVPLLHPMLVLVVTMTLIQTLNVIAISFMGARFVFLNQLAAGCLGVIALVVVLPVSIVFYIWFFAASMATLALTMLMFLVHSGAVAREDLAHALAPSAALIILGVMVSWTGIHTSTLSGAPLWFHLLIVAIACCTVMLAFIRGLDPGGLSELLGFVPPGLRNRALRVLRLPVVPVGT